MLKIKQSAAKVLNSLEHGQSSQTIPEGSTPQGGSGEPLTRNGEGEDIVEINKINFINKSTLKFNKFNYDSIVYVNAKTHINISCPIHGEFKQTPDKHLQSKHGCIKCAKIHLSKIKKGVTNNSKGNLKTFNSFINSANVKYNNKYTYKCDFWEGVTKTDIIVNCPIHGEFTSNARNHIQNNNGHGCNECAKISRIKNKTESFQSVISTLSLKYIKKYDYSQVDENSYKNKKTMIEVNCKQHGIFKIKVQKHLSGQECPKCTINKLIKNNILIGGYCEELFKRKPEIKLRKALIYYLKIGALYKIGITTTNINKRLSSIKSNMKQFNCNDLVSLLFIKEFNLYDCFILEQSILELYKNIRVYKAWSTELISENKINEIKNIIDQHLPINLTPEIHLDSQQKVHGLNVTELVITSIKTP